MLDRLSVPHISKRFLGFALIIGIPSILFASNLFSQWAADDFDQVRDNPYIRSVTNIPRFFRTDFQQSLGHAPYTSGTYRPLTLTSYVLDHALFGGDAVGFHLMNNVLHLLTAIFVFLMFDRILGFGFALSLTILFSIHPMVVEPVAYIGARADLLAGLFSIANAYFLIRTLESTVSKFNLIFFVLTAILGLFSKESVLPVLIATCGTGLIVYMKESCYRLRALTLFFATSVLAAGFLAVRRIVLGRLGGMVGLFVFPNLSKLASHFFELFFVPTLTDFWAVQKNSAGHILVLIGVSIIVVTGVIYIFCRQRTLPFLLGLSLFLTPLIPVSLGWQSLEVLPDRYFYVPLVGFCLLCGSTLKEMPEGFRQADILRGHRTLFLSTLVAYLSFLAFLSLNRTFTWRDDYALANASLTLNPANDNATLWLAKACRRDRNLSCEIRYLRETLAIKPDHLQALNGLAVRQIEVGQLAQARDLLVRAWIVDKTHAATAYNIAYLFEVQGKPNKAFAWYQKALTLNPESSLTQSAIERPGKKDKN